MVKILFGISKIDEGGDDRPRVVIMPMFASIGLFDAAKNFTAPVDMLDHDTQSGKGSIMRPFVCG